MRRAAGVGVLVMLSACESGSCSSTVPTALHAPLEVLPLRAVRNVGTDHAVLVEAADPGGRWVVICQPRTDTNEDGRVHVSVGTHGELSGDGSPPYFVQDDAEGEQIDAYVAHDPSGRFVAFIAEAKLVLVDTVSGTRETLVADTEDDHDKFLPHRAAVFGPAGKSMAYLREVDGKAKIVVRTLSTKKEHVLDPGPGRLWRLVIAAGGGSVGVHVVTTDSDESGALEFPRTLSSIAHRGCRAGGSYTMMGESGDEPDGRIISVSTGVSTNVGRIEGPLGDAWITSKATTEKDEPRALYRVTSEGKATELVPPTCDGVILHSDHERGRVLVACRAGLVWNGPLKAMPMELHGKTLHVPLELWADRRYLPVRESHGSRYVIRRQIRTEHNGQPRNALFDLREPQASRTLDGDEIAFTVHDDRMLVQKSSSNTWVVREISTGRDTGLGTWAVPPTSHRLFAGPYAWVAPSLIDLEQAIVVGELEAEAFALSRTGMLLHAPVGAEPPEYRDLWRGPLTWSR